VAPLRARGWRVEIRTTAGPGEATKIAGEAARAGVDIVAAAGGDGTVHEIVNGLAGSDTALAVFPCGTANVWASEAAIPRDVRGAIEFICEARRARVDLGLIEGAFGRRYFLMMCGLGLDAHVVRRVGEGSTGKRRFGKLWYAAAGAGAMLRVRPVETALTVDGRRLERPLLQAVIGNTRLYGGVMRITSAARADDGLLDLCALSGAGRLRSSRLLLRALRGGLHRRTGDGVDYLRATRIAVEGAPLPIQADGEYIGETPATVSVAPRALTVLLARRPNALLGGR
jgi:YegS/Rv2252/BmrU family lipid kinase